jgi:hypothetical protein
MTIEKELKELKIETEKDPETKNNKTYINGRQINKRRQI